MNAKDILNKFGFHAEDEPLERIEQSDLSESEKNGLASLYKKLAAEKE